jgi:hypothetical protein
MPQIAELLNRAEQSLAKLERKQFALKSKVNDLGAGLYRLIYKRCGYRKNRLGRGLLWVRRIKVLGRNGELFMGGRSVWSIPLNDWRWRLNRRYVYYNMLTVGETTANESESTILGLAYLELHVYYYPLVSLLRTESYDLYFPA